MLLLLELLASGRRRRGAFGFGDRRESTSRELYERSSEERRGSSAMPSKARPEVGECRHGHRDEQAGHDRSAWRTAARFGVSVAYDLQWLRHLCSSTGEAE